MHKMSAQNINNINPQKFLPTILLSFTSPSVVSTALGVFRKGSRDVPAFDLHGSLSCFLTALILQKILILP